MTSRRGTWELALCFLLTPILAFADCGWTEGLFTPRGLASHAEYHLLTVCALALFDDGTGPALYVGGEFGAAGGAVAKNVARWDGSEWSAVGSDLSEGEIVLGFDGLR